MLFKCCIVETNLSTFYRFKREEWEGISAQLSRIALFRFIALHVQINLMQCINKHTITYNGCRTLFHDELSSFINLSADELLRTFQR